MWRKHRLRQRSDFLRLKQEGRIVPHSWMTMSLAKNTLEQNRYGFITGKRLGNAVIRNRTRRHLREAVRHLHPKLLQGNDVIIIAKQGLVGRPFADILRHVRKLFEQANLLDKGLLP